MADVCERKGSKLKIIPVNDNGDIQCLMNIINYLTGKQK
jgi:hypothetical protein